MSSNDSVETVMTQQKTAMTKKMPNNKSAKNPSDASANNQQWLSKNVQ